jgi:hypothetical protein
MRRASSWVSRWLLPGVPARPRNRHRRAAGRCGRGPRSTPLVRRRSTAVIGEPSRRYVDNTPPPFARLVAPAAATAGHPLGHDAAPLRDVRELMRHLPVEHRSRPTWRHVAAELDKVAASADTADVSVALRMALMLEKVECRPA